MKIAIVTLGTGGRLESAESLMRDVRLFGGLPPDSSQLMICDAGDPRTSSVTVVPVTIDYSDLSQDACEQDEFKKFFMFLLPYDRVIYLDSSLSCVGDVSILASKSLNQCLLYARHLPDSRFTDDVLVFNHDLLLGFHDTFLYLARSRLFDDYGHGPSAVLNGYFCHTKRPVGNLPTELNLR